MKKTATLLLLFLFCINCFSLPQAGMKTFFTSAGIKQIQAIVNPLLIKEVETFNIPPVTIDQDGLKLTLSNIKITDLTFQDETFQLKPSNKIGIHISDLSCKCTMDWKYTFGLIHDNGWVDEDVGDVTLDLDLVLGNDGKGHAVIQADSSSCSIGSLDIHLHGGASWLYNIMVSIFKGPLKSTIQNEIGSQFKDQINQLAPKFLLEVPIEYSLPHDSVLNYEMLSQDVTDTWIELTNNAEFYWNKKKQESPTPHHTLPDQPWSQDLQIEMYLDEFAVNSAGHVFTENGFLDFTFTDADVPANFPFHLNTTYFKALIPSLGEKWPAHLMTAQIYPSEYPQVSIDPTNEATANAPMNLNISVIVDQKPVLAFTMGLDINANLFVKMVKENVTAEINTLKITLSYKWTQIKLPDITNLQPLIDFIAKSVITPYANKILQKGFPTPILYGVSLVNTEIGFGDGYLRIGTDFTFNGNI
ncbi:bactericidal permeability-increasing bpi protein-related [Anaeramoeba flamelloides]|uniref:Bactericidal permeability-increasing bpi protein-related n=1 Tax=Anaeramoeba flamelloides TaxID=1746091 RepID=A0AAV7ZMV9_9EUKA|nr:bactericidal permeability-increasing bpi protein-related [Anaeramoeba flamelloides]